MVVRGGNEIKYSREGLDIISLCNMERCASFLARMIEKYGDEVLAEIEAEEEGAAASMKEELNTARSFLDTGSS